MDGTAARGVPLHLGLIVDGNRRWAKARGLSTIDGHARGYEVLKEIARGAFARGIQYVSAFLLSTENWRRTDQEVRQILELAFPTLALDIDQLRSEDIRLLWFGQEERISDDLLRAIRRAEEASASHSRGTICLCLNYGGQEEIVDACRTILGDGTGVDGLTARNLAAALYHPDVPPLDLIVRSGGERRLSNFHLWRAAYAQLDFVDKLWPDFTSNDLDACLERFGSSERRFGG